MAAEAELSSRDSVAVRWAGRALLIVGLVAIALVIRLLLDDVAGTSKFALLFPAVVVATLLWRAAGGAIASIAGGVGVWLLFIRPEGAQGAVEMGEIVSLAIYGVASFLVVFTTHAAMRERAAKLAERDLMLKEISHRTRNSFELVGRMLDQQALAAVSGAQLALRDAAQRVRRIAQAHENLYDGGSPSGEIDLTTYLESVCNSLTGALSPIQSATMRAEPRSIRFDRDRAVLLGVMVNELILAAADRAVRNGGEVGAIDLSLTRSGSGLQLVIAGTDITPPENPAARELVEELARRAGVQIKAMRMGSSPALALLLA
jgi:two-component sensor histidine kinase